jgi:hypothetical protein
MTDSEFCLRPWLMAAVTVALQGAGCETRPYGLAPVSGVVTLDGKPLVRAGISFQPQGVNKTNPGPGCVGTTDDNGHYELMTIRKETGAIPGPHRVRIYSEKTARRGNSDQDVGPPQKELVPPRYNYNTELTIMVPEEGTTTADFKLTTK